MPLNIRDTFEQNTIRLLRHLLWYTPFRRYMFHRYGYNFSPGQLAFLVQCLDETRNVPGNIFEIGCSAGQSACFLSQHLRSLKTGKNYYCIDTFSGFTRDDVAFETGSRGKGGHDYSGFRLNSLKWFKYTLALNGCTNVHPVQADANDYQFTAPVSLCILDVDLYRPTLHALENLWPHLSPGGMVVVDDCLPNNKFDGAYQAYLEFTTTYRIEPNIVLDKLGIIRRSVRS